MSGQGSSCGACKFLRRKCSNACVFAPFFCYEQSATHFAAIHKIFGASNVSKLLSHLPFQNRSEAAITICYEAHARIRDPTYGCVAHIFALQQQVASLQEEIETLAAHVVPPAANNASWGYDQTLSGNIPLQQDAVDLRQLLDQQVPVIAGAANFNSDGFFYGEKNQVELLPLDKEALDTWDPSCSILSNDFINEQCSLGNFSLETVPQEAWYTNSTWCDGVNYQDY